jgi:hypothetical protein
MRAFSYPIILSGIVAIVAQHQHTDVDPFKYSQPPCDCKSFCAGSCSINATAPANKTFYRMTPLHTLGVVDKNTGDAPGDTSYVIARRTAAYDCKQPENINSTHCASMVVTGDVANSTDLVIKFTIETDGNWGPYLYCNPTDSKHAELPWNCSTSHNFPNPYVCECPRAYEVVGRENLAAHFPNSSMSRAGGMWYGMAHQGQCAPGKTVLDGGCSWRVVSADLAVNASCVYDNIDAAVEKQNPACFAPCPLDPRTGTYNRTSDCYSECYSNTSSVMPEEDLTAPWHAAFAGACPPVALPPSAPC